jgi:hypothetical protein
MPKFDPVFALNLVGVLLAFGVVTALYVWPWLRAFPRDEALKILLLPHTFRFVGLSFLVPGVVAPNLSSTFATAAAWGDVGAAILALLSIAALAQRWSFAMPLVWLFNVWGSADLLFAYYQGAMLPVDLGALGAAYYIPTLLVPALLVSHALIFWLLLSPERAATLNPRSRRKPASGRP